MSDALPTRQELIDLKTVIVFLNNWFTTSDQVITSPKGEKLTSFAAIKTILNNSLSFEIDASKVNYGGQKQSEVNKSVNDTIKGLVTKDDIDTAILELFKTKNYVTKSDLTTALKSINRQMASDILVVKHYSEFGDIANPTDKQAVIVSSPGISGVFLYIKNSAMEPDGGCVIKDSKDRIWVRADQSGGSPKWYGAYGDQANDDTAAVTSYFKAGYSHLNFRYMVTDPSLVSQLAAMTGEGGLVYNGDFFPAGEITSEVILRVPTVSFPTVQSALDWLEGKRFDHNGKAVIQVADGNYTLTESISSNVDQWNKVKILGNLNSPSKCQLNFDMSKIESGINFKHGFGCYLLDGFTINAVGRSSTATIGISARDMSQVTVGDNVILNGFDVGMKAYLGGIIKSKSPLSTQKTNATGLTVSNFTIAGVRAIDGGQIKITDIVLDTTMAQTDKDGYGADSNNGIIDIPNATIRGCRIAAYAINSGTISIKYGKVNACKYGGIAINAGIIIFGENTEDSTANATEINGCLKHGIYCHSRGSVTAQVVSILNSGETGVLTEMAANVDLTKAVVQQSKKYGIYARTNSMIIVNDTKVTSSGLDGVKADYAGIIVGETITSNDNKAYGLHATYAGTISITGYVAEGNIINVSPEPSKTETRSPSGSYILLRL